MVNISLLEKSIPVAPIKIAALDSCHELAQKVDSHLVQFRKELEPHNKSDSFGQVIQKNLFN